MSRDCPRCGGPIPHYPALSRTDNATRICSDCGTLEGLEQFASPDHAVTPQDQWPVGSP